MPDGANIARGIEGEPLRVHGSVASIEGKPLSGAQIDVWQASSDGLYDLQFDNFKGAEMNLRARFRTDAEGSYELPSGEAVELSGAERWPGRQNAHAIGRHPFVPRTYTS